ncbi:MAG: type II toxin-antitoxin system HicB family antitoxin [Promethearchaeota archaeon]|nr:MAG: type II toxin-antitoxin system HicB family antitoxin [Candidatus Lokiarchaeota archaeon]
MPDMQFTFLLEEDDNGGYSARCLELKGVYGQGNTEEEALKDVQTALDLALDFYLKNKYPVPFRKIIQVKRDVQIETTFL